ncbi:hypothetical protein VTJ49DRAFT_5155 [Mycothermus thermophilus]|uniref:GPI inositol-deacylase n=1 Tax=Humicola insolens TaxID=85995 RepID=A0ABR3V3S7_HUMIN
MKSGSSAGLWRASSGSSSSQPSPARSRFSLPFRRGKKIPTETTGEVPGTASGKPREVPRLRENRIGLIPLYAPGPEHPTVADVVFVHGLNGGSFSTWSKRGDPDCYWPQQWLPHEDGFQDVRIHAFGYPAAATRESVLNIRDMAQSLLTAIHDSPLMRGGKKVPLIFVAHSMGGLVIKQAYLLGHREPAFQSVVDRISSMFFLGTPHQGASIAQTLSRLTAAIGTRPFVDELFPESPLIQSLTEDFPRLCGDLQLFSFFETQPMLVGLRRMLIVDKSSAVMNLPNERRTMLDANHRNVAMYSTRDDPSYVTVRNALATVMSAQRNVTRLPPPSPLPRAAVSPEDRAALRQFLGTSGAPLDDLMMHQSAKLPGSCGWLASRECYQVWSASKDPSLLWLQGRPGAGKSVLAGHVVGQLRSQGLDCCFFFFQTRDSLKSSVDSCLRSMAYQMAILHPDVLDKLKSIIAEYKDTSTSNLESYSVWHRVFLSGILDVVLGRPQYWVIDAMDECIKPGEMAAYLTWIQDRWPLSVLVTSRDSAELRRHGANTKARIQSYALSEQDNLHDITLFLNANIDSLLCPSSERWPNREALTSQILERSAGCFLWASLVCSELQQATSDSEITAVMDSTPSDMDAFYHDILSRMEKVRLGRETTKAIIAWVTYAFRPLDLAELQTAVELDIGEKVDNIKRVISTHCSSLLYVDQHNKVQLVHLTAREFPTRGEVKSTFILRESDGHRRLAAACFRLLLQAQPRKQESGLSSTASPFTDYASTFLFRHFNYVISACDDMVPLLESITRPFSEWPKVAAGPGCFAVAVQDPMENRQRMAIYDEVLQEMHTMCHPGLHPWLFDRLLEFSNDGRGLLAFVDEAHGLAIWDCSEGKLHGVYELEALQKWFLTQPQSHNANVKKVPRRRWDGSLTFGRGRNSHLLAAVLDSVDLVLFDLDEYRPLAAADAPNGPYIATASSHDGETLGVVDTASRVYLFDFATLQLLWISDPNTIPQLWDYASLTFTRDDLRVICAGHPQFRILEPRVLRDRVTHSCDVAREIVPAFDKTNTDSQEKHKQQQLESAVYCQELNTIFYVTSEGSVFARLLEFDILDWRTLNLVANIQVSTSPDVLLSNNIQPSLTHPHCFTTLTIKRKEYVTKLQPHSAHDLYDWVVSLWTFEDLELACLTGQQPKPRWEIIQYSPPFHVRDVVGIFGNRLVVFTEDGWIASFELVMLLPTSTDLQGQQQSGGGRLSVDETSFVRHFFLPDDLMAELLHIISENFQIAKNGEIIVIPPRGPVVFERGLEITEDGTPVKPQQRLRGEQEGVWKGGWTGMGTGTQGRPPGFSSQKWFREGPWGERGRLDTEEEDDET